MVLHGLDGSPTPLLEPPTLRCTREPNSDLAIRIVTFPSLTCLNPTAQYLDLHHSAASLQIIRHASDAGMALSPSRALGSQAANVVDDDDNDGISQGIKESDN
ncbi:hypothetical protein CSIM01_12150 [Colletotrichum simmondsii]|uniref:Uncharacterized protein n=1 Tax=Colletotrichum simmondsii TaxID=703756 RepID=A0A135TLW6_9PEZI|nr:hypothetical protein CSIM01_12150 [Colletotrichum simmondsii]